jgi:hypothetical protein
MDRRSFVGAVAVGLTALGTGYRRPPLPARQPTRYVVEMNRHGTVRTRWMAPGSVVLMGGWYLVGYAEVAEEVTLCHVTP